MDYVLYYLAIGLYEFDLKLFTARAYLLHEILKAAVASVGVHNVCDGFSAERIQKELGLLGYGIKVVL